MPPSKLELLGPPRLLSPEGKVLRIGGLPLILLAYLALEDIAVSRDHLAELFWPGMDRSRRLHNLRQTVLRLRNGERRDFLEGDGTLRIRPGAVETDVEAFRSHLGQGQVAEGVSLWRGPFLQGVRRPGSWELEDWIDRRRSMLEASLVTAVMGSAREALGRGDALAALALLATPRSLLPEHQELGVLEVVALAGVGRKAEAEGVLATLELREGSEWETEAREALASAPEVPLQAPEAPTPMELSRVPHRRRWLNRALIGFLAGALVLALFAGLLRRHWVRAAIQANDEAGYSLLVCAPWATQGAFQQLYRMGFDGNDKHRLSDGKFCESVWVEGAGAIFGPMPDADPDARLVRLTPNADNPIAEWDVTVVESTSHLRAPWISRGNPKVGAGQVLVFSAVDEEGNRDIYALETVSQKLQRLTTAPEVDEWPTVSPGADRVIFTSHRSGDGDLYSVRLDGTGLTRLTRDPLRDNGAWVRGDSVLFVRGRGTGAEDGNMELVLLDLSTGNETRLTDNTWNDYEQMWSPDGRFICWQSERLGHYEADIMVMDLVTGRSWDASRTPGRESDCRWTPQGEGVLYLVFGKEEGTEVFLRSLKGGPPINLTRYAGEEAVADYFPLPEGMR